MNHYAKYLTVTAGPVAVNMLESFRSFGYSTETAVADILDNSIAAGARHIALSFDWQGSASVFAIKDDGCGMTNDELIQAMRFGARDPHAARAASDLGRFGLGLKTASFSQCRKFTVVSKKKGHAVTYWTWDLDYVYNVAKDWTLIQVLPEGNWLQQLESMEQGTMVIWEEMDRLVKHAQPQNSTAKNGFLEIMERVKQHVATVFHRYIEQKRINITFMHREVAAWNPFMVTHNATQVFPEEPMNNGEVTMRGFVLPHHSKLTPDELKMAEGVKGWNQQQGFYVYRNDRILVAGNWFHLFPKKERYNLARIAIDLPNHLDAEWLIDIKKSKARMPAACKERVRKYAYNVINHAAEVYFHRGRIVPGRLAHKGFQPVWLEKIRDGSVYYEINRAHPVVAAADIKTWQPLLRLLEESLPVGAIYLNESENPQAGTRPFEKAPDEELVQLLKIAYASLRNKHAEQQAKDKLLLVAPFNDYPDLIASL